ncbi:DUF1707 and DUF4870 domain-containing protein [Thermomonospora sp. CIF 1]|uniref:DUF1707 and DUF4870 domain-containing protein n=1 Tax=Thermomonospora sp. CIF 1 TaxID=1916083 RepID=UPI000AA32607|nr:DUF1707 and DUF4870 domain-containing protein [Thermomonospora sp. CIF 1]PKK15009.1 MAG: hypothetical protein BUE48_007665 [Thermomonospora sp. CIF 1]
MNGGGYATTALRVSDAEREPVLERLKDAYAEGRLDHAEFELRMHLAMTAKTRADLAAVMAGLERPVPEPASGGVPGKTAPGPPDGRQRLLAALAHGSGAVPLIIPPLAVMLLAGAGAPYARRQAAEAVNFQLTLLLVTIVTFGLGGIVYTVSWVVALVAAVAALGGLDFRYPWILRLLRA